MYVGNSRVTVQLLYLSRLLTLSKSTLTAVSCHVFCSYFMYQVVEDGYEFFAKRQLVTLFSAPNYCGEFDNAGGMMSVDESLMCSFQVCLRLYVLLNRDLC